ncbi:MAG TPA: hypothetical protein VJT32_02740 [bacterium]|nr:hypothetical protein [bacterium]
MKFLDERGASEWLSDHPPGGAHQWEALGRQASLRIPGDAGKKVAIARAIVAVAMERSAACLLRVRGYGIWPSSELPELYYAVRRDLGDPRRLADAPYHAFGAEDKAAAECFIALTLYFSWDAELYVPARPSLMLAVSNDEVLDLKGETGEAVRAPVETLAALGMSRR